eukprot:4156506-Prymnesium_polylepis.1
MPAGKPCPPAVLNATATRADTALQRPFCACTARHTATHSEMHVRRNLCVWSAQPRAWRASSW